jgi:hypothetical protein
MCTVLTLRRLHPFLSYSARKRSLLTEQEVSRSWGKLFRSPEVDADAFVKAEALLEELRPESPLRHRLQKELLELQRIKKVKDAV